MKVLNQAIGDRYALYHGDSCQVTKGIPDNSIDLGLYSPPFEDLYVYSDSVADLGNSRNTREFFRHFWYLIKELHRITIPGRLQAVHCKDLPRYLSTHGAAGLHDFPGLLIRWFQRAGFRFHSRFTIWKDPVIEAERTNNHGLLYKSVCADSSQCRAGMADYVIVFRKWEGLDGLMSPKPVSHPLGPRADRFDRYVGLDAPDPTPIAQEHGYRVSRDPKTGRWPRACPFPAGTAAARDWSIMVWQKYASPVWFDIDQTRVLNYQLARDQADEKHICPLQMDVAERLIHLYTNDPRDTAEPETVFTPFAGIGSEVVAALELGRRGVGVELKESYFNVAAANCRAIESRPVQHDLFSLAESSAPTPLPVVKTRMHQPLINTADVAEHWAEVDARDAA